MPSSHPASTSDAHSPWSPWDLLPALPEPPESPRGFRVRLSLDETKPPVWRRLLVPGDMTLDRFHAVVQETMGWYDCHLHQFWMGPRGRQRVFLTGWDLSEGEEGIAESDVRLDQVLRQKGDKLRYDYDFGDGWRHTILVEELLEEKIPGPSYTTGRRASPPEDCGWLEEGLGPNHFDVSGINERLALLVRAEHDRSAIPLGDMFGGTASITWP